MKNRQRHGYKQHWSNEYRKLINFRKMDAILRKHFAPRIADLIFSERPLTVLIPRKPR